MFFSAVDRFRWSGHCDPRLERIQGALRGVGMADGGRRPQLLQSLWLPGEHAGTPIKNKSKCS